MLGVYPSGSLYYKSLHTGSGKAVGWLIQSKLIWNNYTKEFYWFSFDWFPRTQNITEYIIHPGH